MLDFNFTRSHPDSQMVRVSELISANPNSFTIAMISKELDISYNAVQKCIYNLKWADWDIKLANTMKVLRSIISITRRNLREARTHQEQKEVSEKLGMYLKRLEDLTAYRDSKRTGL